MNKEIELLHNKLEAQDKIINTQALEIARLKEENKHIAQWWKETNVIIRNDKSLAINDNAMKYILDLEEEIARLKEKLENAKPSWLAEETNDERIKRLEKAKEILLKDRKEATDLFVEYKQRIDKAKEYIQKRFEINEYGEYYFTHTFSSPNMKELLEILEGSNNE